MPTSEVLIKNFAGKPGEQLAFIIQLFNEQQQRMLWLYAIWLFFNFQCWGLHWTAKINRNHRWKNVQWRVQMCVGCTTATDCNVVIQYLGTCWPPTDDSDRLCRALDLPQQSPAVVANTFQIYVTDELSVSLSCGDNVRIQTKHDNDGIPNT